MIAVIEFGHGTEVVGIFPSLEAAKRHYQRDFLYQEFEFGEVQFDYYNAKECHLTEEERR